jgi:3-dehydroquinate synthase
MKIIRLNLKKRAYNIIVGTNIIGLLGRYIKRLNIGGDAYVITNLKIKNKYGRILTLALKNYGLTVKFKLIPDSEKSKSIATAYAVLNDLTRYDKKKRIFIIAFGGGVVGDLAGFIASIYKRGIPYIQVPTTLLAQVDSGIGGKTAVDLAGGKNLVGAFYQPRLVFSELNTLKTLDLRQVRSGLAEAIKYGIIKDAQLFSYLEKKYQDILSLRPQALEFIVSRCSAIKAKIVAEDEKETRGIRTVLNFGHTIGHALEKASGYKRYGHGEAVALGMLVAGEISRKLGLINSGTLKRIEGAIKAVGLPTKIKNVSLNNVIEAQYHDKKFKGAKNRFVLITAIGKARIVEGIPLEVIKESLKQRIYGPISGR